MQTYAFRWPVTSSSSMVCQALITSTFVIATFILSVSSFSHISPLIEVNFSTVYWIRQDNVIQLPTSLTSDFLHLPLKLSSSPGQIP